MARKVLGEVSLSSPYNMAIRNSLKGQELFETFLHECLHTILPDWEEQAVDETSEDIAKAFYQLFDINIKRKERKNAKHKPK